MQDKLALGESHMTKGREVIVNKSLIPALPVVMTTVCFMLAACGAGIMMPQEASNEEAVKVPGSSETGRKAMKTGKVEVVDVTNYYRRAELEQSTPGRGLAIFTTENFVGSSRCAVCHEKLTDAAGNDMSISGHWRSTMMANAANDPLWQAKVSSEVKRNPGLKEVIESKCATCHMPMAWTEAGYSGDQKSLVLDQGFLLPQNSLHDAAMDGVSCSLCHQITGNNLDTKESYSGKYSIDTGTKEPDRKIFGPYKEPVQEVMRKAVGYTPDFGSHINHSALCATCHTLYTPFVDGQGQVAGEFPEQVAYLEWQHSAYNVDYDKRYEIGENPGEAKICQECHMPHSEPGRVYIANWAPPKTEPKDHFSQHHFVGGNALMIDILQKNINGLGLSASAEKFEDTKQRTMNQLQQDTARLVLTDVRRSGDELTARIQVNNDAGHKFPTGIPIRRTWVHLTLSDTEGRMIFESGRPLADGKIAGNDADADIRSFEPHYDLITRPEQVQIYEGVMINTDNEVTYTLLRAASFAKDNRLLPKGFEKSSATVDIAVYGNAVSDENFSGGGDQVTYRINTAGFKAPFSLTARLLFTTVSYPFIKDLEQDRDLSEVRHFLQLYRSADKMPQEIAGIRSIIQ